MIISNGSSQIGIWRLSPYTTYEVGDLVVGDYKGRVTIAPVTTRFTTRGDAMLSNYEKYLSAYNPIGDDYVTRNQAIFTINRIIKYFTASGGSFVVTGDITKLTVPGVYQLTNSTTGLPSAYSSGTLTIIPSETVVRVTISGSVTFIELLDFANNTYFIRSTSSDWVELTGTGLDNISSLLETKCTQVANYQVNAQTAIENAKNRLKYVQSDLDVDEYNQINGAFQNDEIAYVVNLKIRDTGFTRKYSIRLDINDPVGTIYDEYGTERINSSTIKLASNAVLVSIYRFV